MSLLNKEYNELINVLESEYHVKGPIVLFGVEIEFYIKKEYEILINSKEFIDLKNDIQIICKDLNLPFLDFEKEDGFNQFELKLKPLNSPLILGKKIQELKTKLAVMYDIIFSAKPNINQPGSAIHLHMSMYDHRGINIFYQDNEIFEYCIAGLLEYMNESMFIFAPTENCYLRLRLPLQNQNHKHYPTNVSWGFNNRTCAIRIPSVGFGLDKRIEHRVISPEADMEIVLLFIIISLKYGLINKFKLMEPIYGDAFSMHYDYLKPFPINLIQAEELFITGKFYDILRNLN